VGDVLVFENFASLSVKQKCLIIVNDGCIGLKHEECRNDNFMD